MNNLPNNWQVKSLGEVAKLIRGISYDNSQVSNELFENSIPILRANNINEGLLLDDLVYVPSFLVKAEQIIKCGDILIAMSSGSKHIVGKTTQAKSDIYFSFGAFCGLLRPYESIDAKYLGYYFRTKSYRSYISQSSRGANINNLRKESFEKIQIPLPPLQIQKQIAEILEQADEAKQKRKEANRLTDEFLQSVFIEMFGDPVKNPKGWKVKKIKELILRTENENPLTFARKAYIYIDISSIDNESKTIMGIKNIIGKEAPSRARQLVKYNDILVSTVRPNLNAVALIKNDYINPIASTGFCILRTNQKFIIPEYLFYIAKQTFFVNYLSRIAKGASYPAVTDEQITEIEISLPPLSLQQQFAEIVNKTETLKEKQKQSEQELENLFQSLMQRAFKGELIFS